MRLSDVPAGGLFKNSFGSKYRKVLLDGNIGSDKTGHFAISWPWGQMVTWYSAGDPDVTLLNEDGTDVKDLVVFRDLAPGEKFKAECGSVYVKSDTKGYGIRGIHVEKFSDNSLVKRGV